LSEALQRRKKGSSLAREGTPRRTTNKEKTNTHQRGIPSEISKNQKGDKGEGEETLELGFKKVSNYM